MDGLSASLYEWGPELAGLDALGKAELLGELNRSDPLEGTMGLDLDMEAMDLMIGAQEQQ